MFSKRTKSLEIERTSSLSERTKSIENVRYSSALHKKNYLLLAFIFKKFQVNYI